MTEKTALNKFCALSYGLSPTCACGYRFLVKEIFTRCFLESNISELGLLNIFCLKQFQKWKQASSRVLADKELLIKARPPTIQGKWGRRRCIHFTDNARIIKNGYVSKYFKCFSFLKCNHMKLHILYVILCKSHTIKMNKLRAQCNCDFSELLTMMRSGAGVFHPGFVR